MKIGVVILARNESKNIEATLDALFKQTISLHKIVIVNDNSDDGTKEILKKFNVQVIDFPYEHQNWVTKKEMARIFNFGLEKFKDEKYDYIMILGADHILPSNYVENIVKRINGTNIVLASGIIENEISRVPRGSGRVVKWDFWMRNDLSYPEIEGFETYLLFLVKTKGYEYKIFSDIITHTLRKTGTNYKIDKYFHRGKGLSALGYYTPYVLALSLRLLIKNPIAAIAQLVGFFAGAERNYSPEIRKLVYHEQKEKLRHLSMSDFKKLIS